MKRFVFVISVLLSIALAAQAKNELERGFQSPPPEFRPDAFFGWTGGMITREGIRKDMEAMQKQGVGGVLFGDGPDQMAGVVQWSFRDYPGKVKTLSNEWFDMFNFIIGEADRLKMNVYTMPCPGWSHLGGPWVPTEKSLKVLAGKSTNINGPAHFEGILERKPVSYEHKPTLPLWNPPAEVEALKKLRQSFGDYYQDVAVLAYPAGTGTLKNPASSNMIIDLTKKMDAQGRLTWDVPDGNWTVIRLGLAAYNGVNYPAPLDGTGLECDRMDPCAVKLAFESFLGRISREAKAKGYKSLKGFDTDSYESGFQDFSLDFQSEFKKRMGYDCTPWLPAWLDKTIVIVNADQTARFQRDMLRVISDLWLERFYGAIRKWSDEHGLSWMIESYFILPIDWRTAAARAHMPGSEFWVKEVLGKNELFCGDLIGPAPDAAALYGQKVVWAEAFTSTPYNSAMRNDPWLLKPFGDAAFCRGVNHFMLCGFFNNPFGDDFQPGITGFWGTQMSRHVTWWPYSSAWHRYLARCQFLLGQGLPVNDVLAYPPRTEHVPQPVLNCAPYKQTVCNDEALLKRLAIKDGRIVLPHGVSYAALAIPNNDQRQMTPEALTRIRDMIKEGMTLIGDPIPAKSVSMQNYPQCDKEMAALVAEIWGDAKANTPGQRTLGKGRIIWGRQIVEALNEVAGGPDFDCGVKSVALGQKGPRWDFFHRQTPEAEIYFVANLSSESFDIKGSFRVTGRKPQLWDAVTGQTRRLPEYTETNGHTVMPMHFEPRQSFFVIFPKASGKNDKSKQNFPVAKSVLALEGPWQVAFDPKWGGPAKIEFASLEDWSKRPEKGIKYYSGTATYSKTFDAPKSAVKSKTPVYLDLGKVKNIARVRLNGKDMDIVWCAPWRVDVSGDLKSKGNKLEIDVANTWANRMIGDEQEPQDCEMVRIENAQAKGGYAMDKWGTALKDLPDWFIKGEPRPSKGRYTFVTYQFYDKDAPLLESGLIGPVQITAQE